MASCAVSFTNHDILMRGKRTYRAWIARFATCMITVLAQYACNTPGSQITGTVLITQCSTNRTPQTSNVAVCTADEVLQEQDPTRKTCTQIPLLGALITLDQNTSATAVSDAQGHFTLSGTFHPSHNTVVIRADDTVESSQTVSIDNATPTLSPIVFTPAGHIKGRVSVPDATASSAGIRITLHDPVRTAVTDTSGQFIFDNVPTGPRSITAVSDGWTSEHPECVFVEQGATTYLSLPVIVAPPVVLPANLPPTISGPMSIAIADADTSNPTLIIPPPDAGDSVTRGQHLALTCHAQDSNDETLNYAWFASGGTLGSHNDATATLSVDDGQDLAVQCSVFDGRGGTVSDSASIHVYDPFYAGADLFSNDDTSVAPRVILSTAYDTQFDLVVWTPTQASTIALPGSQWLPQARGDHIAFIDRAQGAHTLIRAQLSPTITVDPVTQHSHMQLISADVVSDDAQDYALFDHGVAWIDTDHVAWLKRDDTVQPIRITNVTSTHVAITTYPAPNGSNTSTIAEAIALSTSSGVVTLFDTAGILLTAINTPNRNNGPFAVHHDAVGYWLNGTPYLATSTTTIPLSSDAVTGSGQIAIEQSERNTNAGRGRIRIAYSYYGSPLKFIEPTVVTVEGNAVTDQQRFAVGAKQVIAFDKGRVLVGEPRGAEDVPSKNIWLYDVNSLETNTR